MKKELLRPDEAAAILSVSKWTIYRWVGEGRLRATKIGSGCLRVFSESIEELIDKNTVTSIRNNRHPLIDRGRDFMGRYGSK